MSSARDNPFHRARPKSDIWWGTDLIRPSNNVTTLHWWLTLTADCDRLPSSFIVCGKMKATQPCPSLQERRGPSRLWWRVHKDLKGGKLLLSRQAQVSCLHPGIKLEKWWFPPIPLNAVEEFSGWTVTDSAAQVLGTQRQRGTCLPRVCAGLSF